MRIKGFDISSYQSGIDMSKIKEKGDFVILRGGYTTNGGLRKRRVDITFEQFYNRAKSVGLDVGVYYYSCATNYQEGREDAVFLYNNCLRGRRFEYPIYIDVEDKYMLNAGKRNCTEAVKGFCEFLEAMGYYVGLYTGYYTLTGNMIPAELERYTLWGAWWKDPKTPPAKLKALSNFHLWQYSGGGEQVGTFKIDGDISFINFPPIIKKHKLNGYGEI